MEKEIQKRYIDELFRNRGKSQCYESKMKEPHIQADQVARLIAFYLPKFNTIPENDRWWGEGFTEWTNVTKAIPQFLGHYQPRLPDALGYYDLNHVETLKKQVDLAKWYGLYGFCFYYYWFSGRRVLEKPIANFLRHKEIDFPFCICWANENWTKTWDGLENDVLLKQEYTSLDPEQFAMDVSPVLRDSRYIRVDGKPLLIIYRPAIIPNFMAWLDIWREVFAREGVGEVLVYMVQGFTQYDPKPWGCDGAIEFPPHNIGFGSENTAANHHVINPEFSGEIVEAATILQNARKNESMKGDYRWIRGCCPSWDNDARKPGRGWTLSDSTPDHFYEWLKYIVGEGAPSKNRNKENLVFVNAWNEWAEGAHLEPDRRYGYAYLNRIAKILKGS
ncbi:MAG: glycoside hydrolase family 99-like domain-containing protein [Ketobacter sp.]